MNLTSLFTINAGISTFYGLGSLLAPAAAVSPYGFSLSPGEMYITRLTGAVFTGLAVLSWHARNAPDSQARRSIVAGFFAGDIFGLAAALSMQLQGGANTAGWMTVFMYAFFAVNYGRHHFATSN
ncbi:MAG: hypothetical protein OEY93_03155 [Anaerolineae bacterium]|nr:hypothetical protein [Anaerolineae bacterium]